MVTELELVDLYQNKNISIRKLVNKTGISREKITNILKNHHVTIQRNNKRDRFNENYFETIDTEAKAYLLGFLMADGCVYMGHRYKDGVS